eukprot:gene20554-biopygen6799
MVALGTPRLRFRWAVDSDSGLEVSGGDRESRKIWEWLGGVAPVRRKSQRRIGSFDSSSIPVANTPRDMSSSETGHCYGGIDDSSPPAPSPPSDPSALASNKFVCRHYGMVNPQSMFDNDQTEATEDVDTF